MDSNRFDNLLSLLTAARSRRDALALVLGGTPGLLGLIDATAKKKKGKRGKGQHKKKGGKSSPPAAFCANQANGTSCDESPCKACQDGACVLSADDALCNGTGRCLNGVCNTQPECLPREGPQYCRTSNPAACCSGVCNLVGYGNGVCAAGAAGKGCLENGDCVSNSCTGFICQ
jgi:hypothetical protein